MVKIVINSGPNVPAELVSHYGLSVLPIRMVADEVEHDVLDVTHGDVDRWVASGKQFPYLLGTSAAQFAARFLKAGEDDPELLAIMTSRKLMQSYDSARAAIRTLEAHPRGRMLSFELVDTGVTDVSAGLAVVYAAEAARGGRGIAELPGLLGEFCGRVETVFALRTLENITKGGRASFLKTWIATLLKVRPLLSFEDGEIVSIGRYPAKEDPVGAIVEGIRERVGGDEGPVWVAIAHGGCPDDADRLRVRLQEILDVRYVLSRPLAPSVYLHGGPGSLIASVVPLQGLSWVPTTPAPG